MKITKIPGLGRFGIYIDDVDFNHLSDEEWMEIGQLQLQNLVTIIRNCNMPWQDQPEWAEKFGPRRSLIRYYMEKKYKKSWNWCADQAASKNSELDCLDKSRMAAIAKVQGFTPSGKAYIKISGVHDDEKESGLFSEGDLDWHSNETTILTFTPGECLLGRQHMVGSATGFLTTPDYYENVSESFRSELNDMVIIHRFNPDEMMTGLNLEQQDLLRFSVCPEDDAEMPMVIRSPGGILGLHYSINSAYSIKGMSLQSSQRIFAEINKGLFVDKYKYEHWYQNDNDWCFFESSVTMHCRQGSIKNRLAHRVPHDYTKLHKEFWQPYLQPDLAKRYEKEIVDVVSTCNIKGFRMPDGSLS